MRGLFRRYGGVLILAGVVVGSSVWASLLGDARHLGLVQRLGFDFDALQRFHIWVIPLSPFIQADNGLTLRFMLLMLLTVSALLLLARQAGQRWTFGVFFGAHVVSAFLTVAALALLAEAGSTESEDLLHVPDTGVSAATYGTLAAAFMLLGGRMRLVAAGALVCWLGFGFFYYRLDVAIAHAIAALTGATAALTIPRIRRLHPASGSLAG